MPGAYETVAYGDRNVDAFVPTRLRDLDPVGPAAARAAASAEGALGIVGARLSDGLVVPARLLLRSEGVASSRIEQVRAPVGDIAVAERDHEIGGPAGWVAGNLRAIDAALAHRGPLRVEDLWEWHRLLMAGSDLEAALIGAWRDRIGWIGGSSPWRAAFVPPHHERIPALMVDLLDYVNDDATDPVAQAAVVHAQFETIHPFADGNGRIGRVLISWALSRRLDLSVPPPVSVAFARDIGGYLSGLTRYREDGVDAWVRWFAGTVEDAAHLTEATLRAVAALQTSWPARLAGVRADAAARALLPHLVAEPALDVVRAARLAGVSEQAARGALDLLTRRGVLRAADPSRVAGQPGRPRRWWVAGELLDLLTR